MEQWSNSEEAGALLDRQVKAWPLAEKNYAALEKVRLKTFDISGLTVKVQYNPARIVSSGACTDAAFIRRRPCFLCRSHLPPEQEALPMGNKYLLLCNPYPIFPQHFVIASRRHVEQRFRERFADFLKLSAQLSAFTLFYNGPQCGASAPDHLHFQAVTRGYMPMDEELERYKGDLLLEEADASLYLLTGYLRNGFVLEAGTEESACNLFKRLYKTLRQRVRGDGEPMMNVFSAYRNGGWRITFIPRRRHRPSQSYAEGDEHILTAPGAADVGGVFITALEKDFERITPETLRDIYGQICFDDEITKRFAAGLNSLSGNE